MEKPHYEETEAMTDKTFTQFVAEAAKRGRPRKLRPGEEADTLHIQDQLSKLTHPNHVELHFKDGSKHNIPREHANMALHHLSSLKPIDRADHAEHMAKSHSNFYHVLSKKSIPSKKPKITLAGPKLRKEEAENDDGWYAHKEMHGSKAVSKEDWKKGVRLNKDGKRVQTRKEEAELDESTKDKLQRYVQGAKPERHDPVKGEKRKAGINLALKKIIGSDTLGRKPKVKATHEEVEQLDELGDKMIKKLNIRGSQAGNAAQSVIDDADGGRLTDRDVGEYEKHMGTQKRAYGLAKKIKDKMKTESAEINEWGETKLAKGITGTHASTRQMAATPRTVPLQGRSKKPKKQRLDITPLKTEEKLTPVKDKYLTKEELEIYEALSETGKALFEKMSSDQLAKMVAVYHSKGGKISKGKYNQPRESEKPFPASKMKGSKWASTAGSIKRKNQGYKK